MCWNAATQSAWLCALSPTYVGPGTLNSQPGRKTRVVKPCAAQALTMPVSTLSYWPEAKAWYCWSGLSEPPAMEYIGRAMTGGRGSHDFTHHTRRDNPACNLSAG